MLQQREQALQLFPWADKSGKPVSGLPHYYSLCILFFYVFHEKVVWSCPFLRPSSEKWL